jgi:hypothetical protein
MSDIYRDGRWQRDHDIELNEFEQAAVDGLNTWFETDGFGPLEGKVDLAGILEAIS